MSRDLGLASSSLLLLLLILFIHLPFPLILSSFTPPLHLNTTNQILRDVLKVIAETQNWDPEGIDDISVLEVARLRFAAAQRHQLRIRLGIKTDVVFKYPHQVHSWTNLNFSANAFQDLSLQEAVLDTFILRGPFDLSVAAAAADDVLSLSLPLNASHSGLKRVLVGEGITVEISQAREISLSHPLRVNGSVVKKGGRSGFAPFWDTFCMPLLPIRVVGSASLVAYKNRNVDAGIETTFLSENTIELLPEKCYSSNALKNRARPIHSLSEKIAKVEEFFKTFLGARMLQNRVLGFLRANLKASTIFRFQLELERNVGSNETLLATLAEWRTRPAIERVWFDVLATLQEGKLKPLRIKKSRPFVAVDSTSWSNLMSNISFTKFPSILVPPEPLTLDVKW